MKKQKTRIPTDYIGRKALYVHCRTKALAHAILAGRSPEGMDFIHLRYSETYNTAASRVRHLEPAVARVY